MSFNGFFKLPFFLYLTAVNITHTRAHVWQNMADEWTAVFHLTKKRVYFSIIRDQGCHKTSQNEREKPLFAAVYLEVRLYRVLQLSFYNAQWLSF